MKIYIAGSISNNPNYIEQFKDAENNLLDQGFNVINPVENDGFEYKDYIDVGLMKLSKCDAIYMLNGWENSKGAKLELQYSETVGIRVIFEEGE